MADRDAPGALEHMAFDVDIGSREGVSTDYVARIRIHFLATQTQALISQTQFADTKASALLALIGLVATRVALDVSQGGAGLVMALLFGVKAAVLISCLLVLMPRFPKAEGRRMQARSERFSWVSLASPDSAPSDYARFSRTAEVSQLVASQAWSNAVMSAILLRKFRFLRVAFMAAIVDVLLTIGFYLGWLELTATAFEAI